MLKARSEAPAGWTAELYSGLSVKALRPAHGGGFPPSKGHLLALRFPMDQGGMLRGQWKALRSHRNLGGVVESEPPRQTRPSWGRGVWTQAACLPPFLYKSPRKFVYRVERGSPHSNMGGGGAAAKA